MSPSPKKTPVDSKHSQTIFSFFSFSQVLLQITINRKFVYWSLLMCVHTWQIFALSKNLRLPEAKFPPKTDGRLSSPPAFKKAKKCQNVLLDKSAVRTREMTSPAISPFPWLMFDKAGRTFWRFEAYLRSAFGWGSCWLPYYEASFCVASPASRL